MVCLYELLGVNRTASQKEIAKAYHLLAFKHHPDKLLNCTEEEKLQHQEHFIQLSNAYEILRDSEKRLHYDKYGCTGKENDLLEAALQFFSKREPIQKKDIQSYKSKYINGKEEEDDIIDFYKKHNGDLTKILEYVPFSEATDLPRLVKIVKKLISDKVLEETKEFKKSSSTTALQPIKNKYSKSKNKKISEESYDDLFAKIKSRRLNSARESNFNNLISRLENKYL